MARLRLVPWWGVLGLGVACIAVGAVMLAAQFRSFTALVALVTIGMIITGLAQAASAYAAARPWVAWAVGLGWIAVGIIAAVWLRHGLTLYRLALLIGSAIVIGGLLKIFAAIVGRGDERFILGLSGLTNVVLGLLALTWSTLTIFVLAVILGIRAILYGIGQIALGLRLRGQPQRFGQSRRVPLTQNWPPWVRLTGAAAALVLALGGMWISIAIHRSQPPQPGAFYTAPDPLPAGPLGTIIRSEVIKGMVPNAITYRVLYLSTTKDGVPTAVSGMITVPDGPAPDGGRKILALDHGTVGVASNCAPSLREAGALGFLEGYTDFVAAGYIVAATDYQGLGTKGPHPYAVGQSEGRNVLDIVRAAVNLPEGNASHDFGVWGHSQGGHASIFAAQLAASGYAPELRLIGVAAGAPAPDLVDLFKANINAQIGKILIAMAMRSWAEVYADARLDQIVTPSARPEIAKIATYCLYSKEGLLGAIPSTELLKLTFLSSPPWEVEPWKTISAENTPGATPISAPMLITQGAIDTIVAPAITENFVRKVCGQGSTVDFKLYPGIGHLDGGQRAVPDVLAFFAARFAGQPPVNTCAKP